MLYPQNGDRIVTIDSVTSLLLVYTATAMCLQFSEQTVIDSYVDLPWTAVKADRRSPSLTGDGN